MRKQASAPHAKKAAALNAHNEAAKLKNAKANRDAVPRAHHIDRRAQRLAAEIDGHDDTLVSTRELAEHLGISTQFLEIARHRGYGPAFARLSPRRIRYRLGDVRAWLRSRMHRATAEYRAQPRGEVAGRIFGSNKSRSPK